MSRITVARRVDSFVIPSVLIIVYRFKDTRPCVLTLDEGDARRLAHVLKQREPPPGGYIEGSCVAKTVMHDVYARWINKNEVLFYFILVGSSPDEAGNEDSVVMPAHEAEKLADDILKALEFKHV